MTRSEIQRLAGIGILSFIIILLQTVAGSFRIGPFSVTLALIPIIIGAIVYGPVSGAALGAVFGTYVVVSVIAGLDAGGVYMFKYNAIATILLCLIKSSAAGYLCGLAADHFAKNNIKRAVIISSILAPVVNTGIFIIGLLLFFRPLIASWAGKISVTMFVVTDLIGFNFFFELLITAILVPVFLTLFLFVRNRI